MRRWLAPLLVMLIAAVGAHPFCNAMFRCGCTLLGLTAHCNIHANAPPHCPWCATPRWFLLAALLAFAGATLATRLTWRRTTAFLPSLLAGLVGVAAGGFAGAMVTKLLA